jgi:Domain of unknown function (DUF4124)
MTGRAHARWLAFLALAAGIVCAAPATGQTIYKCKGPDGRVTYTSVPCVTSPGPAAAVAPAAGEHTTVPAMPDAAPAAPAYRPPLPKTCDNAASLQYVIARLDSPGTPDDIREFLAAERFRLLRCEYTRFTSDERRERDAAMRNLSARDAAIRRQAVARIEALYDRYLTPSERAARARANAR